MGEGEWGLCQDTLHACMPLKVGLWEGNVSYMQTSDN